jgi:DNA-binding response OmpR family regulator
LVVEDDAMVAKFIGRALEFRGLSAQWARDGSAAFQLVRCYEYDLVLLDLGIPGMEGEELLAKTVAARPNQKIMVLSGRDDQRTKVRCLDAGAVDFVAKPFTVDELLARINVQLRKPVMSNGGLLTREGLTLDLVRRKAYISKGEVSLTDREFLVLAHLMTAEDDVCSRELLLSEVWGYSFDPGSNVVDVYIRRLRGKLGSDVIETVRNVGYRMTGS